MSVNARAWLGLAFLAVAMSLVLLGAAGTPRYWQAWVYLAVFFAASLAITLDLMRHDPALLERRVSAGPAAEKQKAQRIIMLLASLAFIALLAVPALDHRFRWTGVPTYVVVAGDILTALGFCIVFLVYRENPFTSATVEVVGNQHVVSTGPYAIVRHPMYAGGLLVLLGTPLALGSYWGLLPLAGMVPVLVWRLLDEERLLSRELRGYAEYRAKVCWRLIPGVF